MNQRALLHWMAGIAVLTLALAVWRIRAPRPLETVNPSSTSMESSKSPGSLHASGPVPGSADSPETELATSKPNESFSGLAPVRLKAGQVLVTVNKEPVQLRHLMPVGPKETEMELTREQYDSRLKRAIDIEVVFQAARAEGVELTETQEKRLEGIAERHQADLAHYQKLGVTWSAVSSEQMEFEKRVLAAQMLEQNLVAKKSAAAPSPDPEIQSRYEQARRELLQQLHGRANIAVPTKQQGRD